VYTSCITSINLRRIFLEFALEETADLQPLNARAVYHKFGAERRRRKEGVILSFDPEKLVRVGRLYDLGTRIQTKTANGVGDVDGEDSGEEIQTCQPGKEGAGRVGGGGSSGDTPGLSAHLGS
jgi:hypothetical protein